MLMDPFSARGTGGTGRALLGPPAGSRRRRKVQFTQAISANCMPEKSTGIECTELQCAIEILQRAVVMRLVRPRGCFEFSRSVRRP